MSFEELKAYVQYLQLAKTSVSSASRRLRVYIGGGSLALKFLLGLV
jgi:hypothetical protein